MATRSFIGRFEAMPLKIGQRVAFEGMGGRSTGVVLVVGPKRTGSRTSLDGERTLPEHTVTLGRVVGPFGPSKGPSTQTVPSQRLFPARLTEAEARNLELKFNFAGRTRIPRQRVKRPIPKAEPKRRGVFRFRIRRSRA